MSWWGGGEIRATPALLLRSQAMYASTLGPGSWPPSPGLAPWATLISNWRPLRRYSGVTPKRPEAICFMAEQAVSPLRSPLRPGRVAERPSPSTSVRGRKRAGSSPPSPLLLLPPIRFMAIASTSWASRERAPRLMPPVQKRAQMLSMLSTWSIGRGTAAGVSCSRSRRAVTGRFSSRVW